MALFPPAPSPPPAFASGLIHWVNDTFIDPYRYAYTWISAADNIEEMIWRYVVVTFNRLTPANTVEDRAQVGFNIVNMTNGSIDTSWDEGDYTTVNSAIGEFLNQWASLASSTHTANEIRYYVRGFNPDIPWGQPVTTLDPSTGKPYDRFTNSGSVEAVFPVTKVGASVGPPAPYQAAMSMTFRTAQRKHWGRVYLPGVGTGETANFGRFTSLAVTTVANAGAHMVDYLQSRDFLVFVPTTQVGGNFHAGQQTITEVVVDDIPDVIRRRRPKQPAIKQVGVPS